MEILESIAWIILGFVPMLGSMELAWRLRKRSTKPKYKATEKTSLAEMNRRLVKFSSGEFDRVWIREV